MIPAASQIISSITSGLVKILSVIPLWGKIIAGVIIGSALLATYTAGSQGRGFRIGVELGWFSIKGVCEYTY